MGGKVDAYIDIVLLGAINAASAKAKYGNFDARRSSVRLYGAQHDGSPLRVLHFIKANYSDAVYQTAWHWFLHCFWEPPNANLTKPDVLAKTLADAPRQYPGDTRDRLFSEADVKKILEGAATQEIKDSVKAKTQEAIERGAFGAPWFWVVNDEGKGEPFFGSDRFHYMYEYLGVPYQDIAILPPQGKSAKL
ncbi:glutathione s-transferase kappa 2 [Colletotrichum liriopes]|uniref:Glutathione s-transferase kappa 2 n=1 Tax=Colletotrichum liriopes TaxID=708192 RepID=A0AA37GSN9_9PEZI|nr:glutathione s-transferase kappa 2 [Colletotrichum liriopes]